MTPDPCQKGPVDADSLIRAVADKCRECWSCARLCPANAITIADGTPQVLADRCVACGACVLECSKSCFEVRDDLDRVRRLLEGHRPVVIVLATEFITALHPLVPREVEHALEALGFHAVETTLLGEEMVAQSYERLCAQANGSPVVRSTCAVVTEWVRRYRPSLADALAPVVPPYVAQGRLVKKVYPGDVVVVYASPCFARKEEARQEQFADAVDVAIDFLELRALMSEVVPAAGTSSCGLNRPAPLKELSLTDGFPRAPLEERSLTSTDIGVARGLHDVDRMLHAIEIGETTPSIVDLLNCEGCIDGPAVNPGMSVFAKRNIDVSAREALGDDAVRSGELLEYLPEVSTDRPFGPAPVREEIPTDDEIDAILADGGFASRDDVLDCRACGYRTCVEFAAAIHRDSATWDMCFPLQRNRLTRDIAELETSATIDPVTGLWNRNALTDRIADEVARFGRYRTPVALLMIDLDGFKPVNDKWGHLVGDQLLGAVGHLLAGDIRTSDFAARYGGDEFAVVLPGTTKTEAYAVAEKLRSGIAGLTVIPRSDPHEGGVGVTASIGVASATDKASDAIGLIEAADRALYSAKEGGRDQVRLAPRPQEG